MGMNITNALLILQQEQKNDDTESAHANADRVLCDLLTELGYGDVVAEYDKVNKWFA
jgi:hypothetical protein